MVLKDFIFGCLEVLPLIRRGFRWFLERNMEVIAKAHFEDMEPYAVAHPDSSVGRLGSVWALLDLRLINHSTDRPERIIECWAELRKRKFLFWHRTFGKFSVISLYEGGGQKEIPIKNVLLEPIGAPQDRLIQISGTFEPFQKVEMPRRSELILVFSMVGPMRKYIYKLTDVTYDPK